MIKTTLSVSKTEQLPAGTLLIDEEAHTHSLQVERVSDSNGNESVIIQLGHQSIVISNGYSFLENGHIGPGNHVERITRHLGRMLTNIADTDMSMEGNINA